MAALARAQAAAAGLPPIDSVDQWAYLTGATKAHCGNQTATPLDPCAFSPPVSGAGGAAHLPPDRHVGRRGRHLELEEQRDRGARDDRGGRRAWRELHRRPTPLQLPSGLSRPQARACGSCWWAGCRRRSGRGHNSRTRPPPRSRPQRRSSRTAAWRRDLPPPLCTSPAAPRQPVRTGRLPVRASRRPLRAPQPRRAAPGRGEPPRRGVHLAAARRRHTHHSPRVAGGASSQAAGGGERDGVGAASAALAAGVPGLATRLQGPAVRIRVVGSVRRVSAAAPSRAVHGFGTVLPASWPIFLTKRARPHRAAVLLRFYCPGHEP